MANFMTDFDQNGYNFRKKRPFWSFRNIINLGLIIGIVGIGISYHVQSKVHHDIHFKCDTKTVNNTHLYENKNSTAKFILCENQQVNFTVHPVQNIENTGIWLQKGQQIGITTPKTVFARHLSSLTFNDILDTDQGSLNEDMTQKALLVAFVSTDKKQISAIDLTSGKNSEGGATQLHIGQTVSGYKLITFRAETEGYLHIGIPHPINGETGFETETGEGLQVQIQRVR